MIREDPMWKRSTWDERNLFFLYRTGLANHLSAPPSIMGNLYPLFPEVERKMGCLYVPVLRVQNNSTNEKLLTGGHLSHSELWLDFSYSLLVHSFTQPSSEHLLPSRLSVRLCAFYSFIKTPCLPLKNCCSSGEALTCVQNVIQDVES
jgi:hypothetical protein